MSDACQKCGPAPRECPTVLCAPCAITEAAEEDRDAVLIGEADRWPLKRLAWAYGCAPRGSRAETELGELLMARIVSEGVAAA
jgi:hypothetical protein